MSLDITFASSVAFSTPRVAQIIREHASTDGNADTQPFTPFEEELIVTSTKDGGGNGLCSPEMMALPSSAAHLLNSPQPAHH